MNAHTKENFIADFYSESKRVKVSFYNDKYHYICRISTKVLGEYVEHSVVLHDINEECGIPQILNKIFEDIGH